MQYIEGEVSILDKVTDDAIASGDGDKIMLCKAIATSRITELKELKIELNKILDELKTI